MAFPLNYRNPLVWLRRIRHRRGYGVHSPFAYQLLSQVVYSPGEYYAYRQLNQQHTLADRLLRPRRRAVDRLLFRLVNFQQPRTLCALGASPRALRYLKEGCHTVVVAMDWEALPEMLYINKEKVESGAPLVADGGLVVVDGLRQNRHLWRQLRRSGFYQVMFDLHDVGLAFRRDGMLRDYYVVNW